MTENESVYINTDVKIKDLLAEIDNGKLGLPDLQRPFVWNDAQVRDLFDSLFRRYPAGTLMLWKAQEGETVGRGKRSASFHRLIVDGQQRLTSLYSVIYGKPVYDKNKKQRKIQISFKPETGKFEVFSAAYKNSPEWIADISEYYEGLSYSHRMITEFCAKQQTNDRELLDNTIPNNIQKMLAILDIHLSTIVINEAVDGETVANIFVRVNSGGLKLKQSDFIFTIMSVYCLEARDKLEEFNEKAHTSGTELNGYIIIPTSGDMLRVAIAFAFHRARLRYAYEILRGKDLSKRGNVVDPPDVMAARRDEQFAKLNNALDKVLDKQNWRDYLDCIEYAGFRSRRMLNNTSACTYSYALYLIGKFGFAIKYQQLKPAVARWFFMSLLTSRYASGAEGTMESELANIQECKDSEAFLAYLNKEIKAVLTNDFWNITLPRNLAVSAATPPAQSAFWAAQVLLNAHSLFINDFIAARLDQRKDAKHSALERHHLFPKAHLERIGFAQTQQNQVANMALIDWHINNAIRDSEPTKYTPSLKEKWLKNLNGDEEMMKRDLRLNAMPEGWENMNYPEFLEKRRVLMAAVIREGFETL